MLLVAAATQRDALENSLGTVAAANQADEMIVMTLVVCAGVGLLHAAVSLAIRNGVGPQLGVSRRTAGMATAVAAVVAVVVALAAGAPGEISDRWQEFKAAPEPHATDAARFESAAGGARYQLWNSALDANAADPLTGIGPGSFEFWESRTSASPGFVRDAHSLYLETLAELGIVGFVMVVALIALILGVGVLRSVRGPTSERRAFAAAGVAACTVFAVAAAIDWAWELTVLPVAMLLLAAALLGPSGEPRASSSSRFRHNFPGLGRPLVAFAAVLGLIAVGIPLAGASALRDSQDRVQRQELPPALDGARRAAAIQPYAASPALQEAMVLELQGDLNGAAEAATTATEQEATNWRTWLVLSRIEARRGNVSESVDAYRRARELNPLSPIFQ